MLYRIMMDHQIINKNNCSVHKKSKYLNSTSKLSICTCSKSDKFFMNYLPAQYYSTSKKAKQCCPSYLNIYDVNNRETTYEPFLKFHQSSKMHPNMIINWAAQHMNSINDQLNILYSKNTALALSPNALSHFPSASSLYPSSESIETLTPTSQSHSYSSFLPSPNQESLVDAKLERSNVLNMGICDSFDELKDCMRNLDDFDIDSYGKSVVNGKICLCNDHIATTEDNHMYKKRMMDGNIFSNGCQLTSTRKDDDGYNKLTINGNTCSSMNHLAPNKYIDSYKRQIIDGNIFSTMNQNKQALANLKNNSIAAKKFQMEREKKYKHSLGQIYSCDKSPLNKQHFYGASNCGNLKFDNNLITSFDDAYMSNSSSSDVDKDSILSKYSCENYIINMNSSNIDTTVNKGVSANYPNDFMESLNVSEKSKCHNFKNEAKNCENALKSFPNDKRVSTSINNSNIDATNKVNSNLNKNPATGLNFCNQNEIHNYDLNSRNEVNAYNSDSIKIRRAVSKNTSIESELNCLMGSKLSASNGSLDDGFESMVEISIPHRILELENGLRRQQLKMKLYEQLLKKSKKKKVPTATLR